MKSNIFSKWLSSEDVLYIQLPLFISVSTLFCVVFLLYCKHVDVYYYVVPTPPTTVVVSLKTQHSLYISWEVADGNVVDSYRIVITDVQMTSLVTAISIPNLEVNTEYTIHVYSVSNGVESTGSAPVRATTCKT